MDIILDIIFELLFEGAVEASRHPKVPKPVRIILIILLASFYLLLIGIFVHIAVRDRSIAAAVIAVFILVITVLAAKKTYSRYR